MRRLLIIFAVLSWLVAVKAQTVVDNFTVGPYIVDYNGQGDVKYRLRDNIDLYDYFELQKDTTIVLSTSTEVTPVNHAVQISGYVGTNRYEPKEIGVSGVWKQLIGKDLYFNGGLSLGIGYTHQQHSRKRTLFEVGIPLQVELGRLSHQRASLYGAVGITPTVYATMTAKVWDGKNYVDVDKDQKKSGFMIAPSLEFGGNVPVGSTIVRIGVYGKFNINCTSGTFDVYRNGTGRLFLGAKIGVVL